MVSVTLGAFAVGTSLSWTSPALPLLSNSTTSPLEEDITDDEGMWIGSLLAIGALIGAFPAGYLADTVGRKLTLAGLALPFILSWLLIIFANSIGMIYSARIFAGIATGGALGSYFQLLLTIGILFSYGVGAFLNYTVLGISCCIIPIIYLAVFFFMPETPSFLLSKGKRSEAISTLKWFRGDNYDVRSELCKIEEEITEARENKATFKDLISSNANINALVISLGLMLFQQLSGINAVIFYTASIFQAAGSDLDSNVCAIIVGAVQVVVTYFATLLVDLAGRKILLLISSGVMCVCLNILGFYFYMKEKDESSVQGLDWVPLVCVCVYIICFSLGFGPLPWMMMSELFSNSIKGLASGLAVSLNWILTFVVTRTFVDIIAKMGTDGAFWLFGVITAIGFLFVCLLVKETKGKSFVEIQRMLGKGFFK
ncbi:UNVERIFIED_CONTAM: hypothetical protein PYX00_004355 [Menopon gallinae]|uniref:Major facilitator superfamily (MFS) profile domain-containing protein n=1 Tax=Menopon gallinae TaxID=328185 RepID=A0AAW2I449_9NEOP